MGVQPFWPKRPWEKLTIALDFTAELPTGVTLSSGACKVYRELDEQEVTNTMLLDGTTTTQSGGNKIAAIVVSAGDRGRWYRVLFQMTLSDSQKKEGVAKIFVDE